MSIEGIYCLACFSEAEKINGIRYSLYAMHIHHVPCIVIGDGNSKHYSYAMLCCAMLYCDDMMRYDEM